MLRPSLLAAAVTVAALAAAASASDPLDPFPSLRSVGDTVYTTLHPLLANKTGNATDPIKGEARKEREGGKMCVPIDLD